MNHTYPESSTKITDPLSLYRCRCGHITWALTMDKPVYCKKCGERMIRIEK